MKYCALILLVLVSRIAFSQDKRMDRETANANMKVSETLISKPYILEQGQLQLNGDDGNNRSIVLKAIKESDQKIKEYETKVLEFINSKPAPDILSSRLSGAKAKASSVQTEISMTEKVYKQERTVGYVNQFQKLFLYQAFLSNMIKVYPQEVVFKNFLEKVKLAISSYGSRESFMNQLEANNASYLKNLKLIPAQQSNPSIEKMVKTEFEKLEGNGLVVTKVNITTAQWNIEKNDLDLPLYRKMSVSIAVKKSDGTCGLASAMVKEDYQGGGSYGQASMYLPTDVIVVPCENIK